MSARVRVCVCVCENVPRQFVAALVPTTLLFSGVWLIVSITRAQRASNEKVKSVSPVGWWSISGVSSSFSHRFNTTYKLPFVKSFADYNIFPIRPFLFSIPLVTSSSCIILLLSLSFCKIICNLNNKGKRGEKNWNFENMYIRIINRWFFMK